MSDVAEAQPGDVFVDEAGRIWKVMSKCDEPSVYMECLEKAASEREGESSMRGGVSGRMWDGFKRIYRRY